MDADIRDLERAAKQSKAPNDISAWVLALIRAGKPLPIRTSGWGYRSGIRRTAIDGPWGTSRCQHNHPSKGNARACAKRKYYERLKADIVKVIGQADAAGQATVFEAYLEL